MSEVTNNAPQEPSDPYQKPEFPFHQQDFDGNQPEVSPEEQAYVESIFAGSIDKALDRAQANPDRRVDLDSEETGMHEDGETSESVFLDGPDGRPVAISKQYDRQGKVMIRSANLYWDEDMIGSTKYYIFYHLEDPAVLRDDDTGRFAPGKSLGEGFRDKLGAELDETAYGFNNQPIGETEAKGLEEYLQACK